MLGKCALCGKDTEMTFEHIPPRSCFNSKPVKSVSGDVFIESMSASDRDPWDTSGLTYKNQQMGMGEFSLCSDCNSKTGKWYGSEYAKFAHTMHRLLIENKPENNTSIVFEIFEAYPLRIVKQMLSMICSINQDFYGDDRIRRLAEFVLQKDAVGLNKKKYKIFIYLINNNTLVKQCSMSWLIKGISNNERPIVDVVSELFAYPLGIVVCFDPREDFNHAGADITDFCNVDYMHKDNITLDIPILESNIVFPCDYRSKEELIECVNGLSSEDN